MKQFSIEKNKFLEQVQLGLENFPPSNRFLEKLLTDISVNYTHVNIYLVDNTVSVTDLLSKSFANNKFPVFLEHKNFTDDSLFVKFQKTLSDTVVFSNFIDTIQANSPAIIKVLKNDSSYLYDLLNFNIMLLTYMISNLSKKLYGSEMLSFEEYDKLTILTTYGVFRYILQYDISVASVKAVDFLNNSTILLKSSKYKNSRLNINIALEKYVSHEAKDLFELFVFSGLFSELISKKQFLQSLSLVYSTPLVRALLVSPGSKNVHSNLSVYVYRGIIISISDILQNLNVYQKFSRFIEPLNNTVFNILTKIVKEEYLAVRKQRI